MTRSSSSKIHFLSWRTIRWVVLLPAIPLVWWACISHPLTQPTPNPQLQSNAYISVSPTRKLDLVFMIDNSPSMAPKQQKLQAQFPNLINALEDPNNNNALPDLQVAIIDSDLGTDNQWTPGGSNCSPNAANGQSGLGDQGKFRMIDPSACGVTDSTNSWLIAPTGGTPNFTGHIADVFACLAGQLGTDGCGEEHQLQAFEFALAPNIAINQAQKTMIRNDALLGLVFLTDEDDCSAYPNDGMFGQVVSGGSTLPNETASLRCSTRAYQCNGNNLSDETTPDYPTQNDFETPNFTDCLPRTDYCTSYLDNPLLGAKYQYDTSKPTTCNPLTDYRRIAKELKSIKGGNEDQILVAGIFGYPMSDGSHDTIKFAKHANEPTSADPNPTPAQVFDYWSFCYDPNHRPAATTDDPTGFDINAWGWGAGPGIRESAFVDQFKNGLKFSICETDYSAAMSQIGNAIAPLLQNLCVPYKLWNLKPGTTPAVPDCKVNYLFPSGETSPPLVACPAGVTTQSGSITQDCWFLVQNSPLCPTAPLGQLIRTLRTNAEADAGPLPSGTLVQMECLSCPSDYNAPADSQTAIHCSYDVDGGAGP